MFVEGRVLATDGKPIPNAVIETWETDEFGMHALDNFTTLLILSTHHTGFYDTQYEGRTVADCRGRLRSGPDGSFSYRAVVPVSYPIPGDVLTFFFNHLVCT
jgi:protocatechuate 3,4-dioxygenase beta subunit